MLEPVEVASKLTEEFFAPLQAAKWTERRDQLDALIKLLDVPRIRPGDFTEVVKHLKRLLGDANVIVVGRAAKAIALLARGLRRDFAGSARALLGTLLDRLKEKKAQVTEPVNEALDAFHGRCFVLGEVLEDVAAAAEHKVPKVRADTLAWISRCLAQRQYRASLAQNGAYKTLAGLLVKALDDGTPEVRDAAAAAFGVLAAAVGERALVPFISKLDPIKEKKVREAFPEGADKIVLPGQPPAQQQQQQPAPAKQAAVPKAKPKPAGSAAAPPKAKPPPPVKAKAPSAASKQPPVAKEAKPGSGKEKEPSAKGSASAVEEDLTAGGPSLEEALEKVSGLVGEAVVAGLEDKNWKARLEAAEQLLAWLAKQGDAVPSETEEALVRLLQARPGWKDTNLQVLGRVFDFVARLSRLAPQFSRRSVALCVPGLVEKLADAKLKASAQEALTSLAEATSPALVHSLASRHALAHKNPKVAAEALEWTARAVEEFGLASIPVQALLETARQALDSTNPQVKTAAIRLLCQMRKEVPSLRDFLGQVKPALLTTIDQEFEKVAGQRLPAPTRQYRHAQQEKAAGGRRGGGSSRSGGSGEIELPREDISSRVDGKLLAELGDKNWKTRKEALDQVQALLVEAHRRIQGRGLGELFAALKPRLADSNKMLVRQTCDLLAQLAQAIGPPVQAYLRPLLPALLEVLADTKKDVRDAALAALDALAQEAAFEPFVAPVAAALEASPASRTHLLPFVVRAAQRAQEADLRLLVRAVLACLQDRLKEVRDGAEALLLEILRRGGLKEVRAALKDLKPAVLQTVQPIVDRLQKDLHAAKPPVSAPAPAAPAAASSGSEAGGVNEKKKDKALLRLEPRAPPVAEKPAPAPAPAAGTPEKPEAPPAAKLKPSTSTSRLKPPSSSISTSALVPVPVPVPAPASTPAPVAVVRDKVWRAQQDQQAARRWGSWETPSSEWAAQLQAEAAEVLPAPLLRRMFASEPRQLVDALQELVRHVASAPRNVLVAEQLDLLLKYATLQLAAGAASPSLPARALDLLRELFALLQAEQYRLSEYEAGLLVPHLLRRLAEAAGSGRACLVQLLRALLRLHPSSRLFQLALATMRTSSRPAAQAACLDFAAHLIRRQGATVCTSADLAALAQVVLEHAEPPVRRAALGALWQAQQHLREDLWRPLAQLPAAQLQQLHAELAALPAAAPDPFELEAAPDLQPLAAAVAASEEAQQLAAWAAVLRQEPRDEARLVETMKEVCLRVAQVDEGRWAGQLDALVEALTALLRWAFEEQPAFPVRVSKYAINTLVELLKRPRLASSVSMERLGELMELVLVWLVDARVAQEPDFLRAFNTLMLKVLENGAPTATHCVLVRLLALPASERHSAKFTELVMKCLLKLTKALAGNLPRLDLAPLLNEVHLFLLAPRPPLQPDMPLRTLRTLLHELLRLKGPALLDHLTLVPNPCPAQPPPIFPLLHQLLQQLSTTSPTDVASAPAQAAPISSSAAAAAAAATAAAASSSSSSTSASSADTSLGAATKSALGEILKRIGNPATTQVGLQELWQFRRKHADLDLEPYLRHTSQQFQAYIQRSLARLDSENQRPPDNNQTPAAASASAAQSAGTSAAACALAPAAADYMERLCSLRERFGISRPASTSALASQTPATSVSVDDLRQRLMDARLDASAASAASSRLSTTSAPTTLPGSAVGSASLSDIQERLARLKKERATQV
jgi:cytoskeleton-associated protein 5